MLEKLLSLQHLKKIGRKYASAFAGLALMGCVEGEQNYPVTGDINNSIDNTTDQDTTEQPKPDVYTPYGLAVKLNGYNQINRDKLDVKYLDATACLGFNTKQQEELSKTLVYNITGKISFPCKGKGYEGLNCLGEYDPLNKVINLTEIDFAGAHETVHAAGYYLDAQYKNNECGSFDCGKDNPIGKCGNEVDWTVDFEFREEDPAWCARYPEIQICLERQ